MTGELVEFQDGEKKDGIGLINQFSKQDAAIFKRRLAQLQKYLGEIKYMTRCCNDSTLTIFPLHVE